MRERLIELRKNVKKNDDEPDKWNYNETDNETENGDCCDLVDWTK